MAEESDLEKTEDPSPRKIQQAREEGQVPTSRELSTFLVLITGVLTLWLAGNWFVGRIVGVVQKGFDFSREQVFDSRFLWNDLIHLFAESLLTLAPLFALLLVSAVGAPIILGSLVFSPKALEPKFSRLNPLSGIKRVFSVNGVVEAIKALLKSFLIGAVGALVIWAEWDALFSLMYQPLDQALPGFIKMLIFSAVLIASSMLLLVLLDVPFQLWQYTKNLRMTKEEVRRENKEQEGDPHVKARIRRVQMEMARKRMMAEVPKADVVVTNPTHFAVALRYDPQTMQAPVLIAKGRGEIALKIRDLAAEHEVPILRAPPLARALFVHCDLEEAVPSGLYSAVAQVMAYVYQLNEWMEKGGQAPSQPKDLAVPEGLDPGSPDEEDPPNSAPA
jgi:flagellar biosynthesis protein FlhB